MCLLRVCVGVCCGCVYIVGVFVCVGGGGGREHVLYMVCSAVGPEHMWQCAVWSLCMRTESLGITGGSACIVGSLVALVGPQLRGTLWGIAGLTRLVL
jgi:hypothetical protein